MTNDSHAEDYSCGLECGRLGFLQNGNGAAKPLSVASIPKVQFPNLLNQAFRIRTILDFLDRIDQSFYIRTALEFGDFLDQSFRVRPILEFADFIN